MYSITKYIIKILWWIPLVKLPFGEMANEHAIRRMLYIVNE